MSQRSRACPWFRESPSRRPTSNGSALYRFLCRQSPTTGPFTYALWLQSREYIAEENSKHRDRILLQQALDEGFARAAKLVAAHTCG